MRLIELPIEGAFRIQPARFEDHRGHFSVVFNREALEAAGLVGRFVQENQSYSAAVGTLRGLHCQHAPFEQTKLVRVLAGRALDVLVDVRPDSATFGHSCAVDLCAENGELAYVPKGCLHGFVTREAGTVISYHVDAAYAPQHERSIAWNDPELGIDWGMDRQDVILSDRDRQALSWNAFCAELSHRAATDSGSEPVS